MTKYYVIKETTCPKCKGTGWITNPVFIAINEEDDEINKYVVAEAYGYNSPDDVSEEVICDECNGKGILEKKVLLEEAIIDILKNK